ncbi:MAG: hypothetical protein CM15mP85_30300 [Rhodobacterales bacterium]|nr:MAG: hypothetical protein CM15mP85_30300 [Rhodobacterales bacterium]
MDVLGYNDAHYSDVNALLSEGRGVNCIWVMAGRHVDVEPGNDWIVVQLGTTGTIMMK